MPHQVNGNVIEMLACAFVDRDAIDLAREAGGQLLEGYGLTQRGEVGYKGWRNLVTRFDREVEQLVVDRISERYPDHAILADPSFALA